MSATKPSNKVLRLLSETRLSLTDLAKEQGVATQTAWRWSTRGIKGHILETYNVGAKNFTTREAFTRWVSAINGGSDTVPACEYVSASSDERELQSAGILD